MKQLKLFVLGATTIALLFASCSKKEKDDGKPVNLDEVLGSYTGTISIPTKENPNAPQNFSLTVFTIKKSAKNDGNILVEVKFDANGSEHSQSYDLPVVENKNGKISFKSSLSDSDTEASYEAANKEFKLTVRFKDSSATINIVGKKK